MNKLNEAELKLNTLRKTSAENAPSVIALKGQIAQLKPSLLENLRKTPGIEYVSTEVGKGIDAGAQDFASGNNLVLYTLRRPIDIVCTQFIGITYGNNLYLQGSRLL